MSKDNYYLVYHEKGGSIGVFAKDEDGAIDAFYDSIKSMIGHQLKICKCFGDKPLDRSKFIRPIKVVKVDHPCLKIKNKK